MFGLLTLEGQHGGALINVASQQEPPWSEYWFGQGLSEWNFQIHADWELRDSQYTVGVSVSDWLFVLCMFDLW